ncbi:hypothetical protein Q7P37_011081 [Cladosporium fusiforme]
MTSSRRHIHWVTPTTILFALLAGLAFALGHHFFYARLSGQPAPVGYHQIRGLKRSKQQVNIAVGTAFAFLVKTALAIAIAASYMQLFWRLLKTSKKPTLLPDVDTAFSLLQDFTALCRWSSWRKQYIILTPIALICWLLPLASVFPPATLTVLSAPKEMIRSEITTVPKLDFGNQYFATWLPESMYYEYNGPSMAVRRIAAASGAQGSVLPMTPPALNSSWSTQFFGPAIHCEDVGEPNRTSILNNYGAYAKSESSKPGDGFFWFTWQYFAWVARASGDILPFDKNDGGPLDLSDARLVHGGQPTLFMAFDAHNDAQPTYAYANYNPEFSSVDDIVESNGGFGQMLRNFTILTCQLFNSSYTVDFDYINGSQEVNISRPQASADKPVEKPMNVLLGDQIIPGDCSGKTVVQQSSFMAINDAFNDLLRGRLPYAIGNADSGIVRTVLAETDDLPFLASEQRRINRWPAASFFTGQNKSPASSRGSLIELLEGLFENVTVSMLSEPTLQPNFSSRCAVSPLAEVTFEEWHNIYAYDAATLWAAYGAAIISATIAVSVGFSAMHLNGAAYDANFSTILRTSQISEPPRMDDHDPEPGDERDDGSKPLPKSLEKAIVLVNAEKQELCSENISSALGEIKMEMLSNPMARDVKAQGLLKSHTF